MNDYDINILIFFALLVISGVGLLSFCCEDAQGEATKVEAVQPYRVDPRMLIKRGYVNPNSGEVYYPDYRGV